MTAPWPTELDPITRWPTNGNLSPVIAYLNSGVDHFRRLDGRYPTVNDPRWETEFFQLPHFTDAQVTPIGVGTFGGGHEFQGDAGIVAREADRIQTLSQPYYLRFLYDDSAAYRMWADENNVVPPVPDAYDEWRRSNYAYLTNYARMLEMQQPPVDPATGDAMPLPIDPNTGLPVGTPPTPPSGGTPLPAGTPDPNSPPFLPPSPRPETYTLTCEFTGRVVGTAVPVPFEDVTLFRLPATGKVEVVVKRADVPTPNFFVGSLTDIGFTLTVTRKSDGQKQIYTRPEGKPVEALLYFA